MSARIIQLSERVSATKGSHRVACEAYDAAMRPDATLETVEHAMLLIYVELQKRGVDEDYAWCAQNAACYGWTLDALNDLRKTRRGLLSLARTPAVIFRFADFARVAGRAVKREANRRCGICRESGHNRATCQRGRRGGQVQS